MLYAFSSCPNLKVSLHLIYHLKNVPLFIKYRYVEFYFVLGTLFSSVQLLSRVRLCNLMNCSTPDFPVHHLLPESTEIHAHRVGDAIYPSHPLSPPSPPAPNPSQHQGLFQWVNSSHEVAKVLEFQLQPQSFQRCWLFSGEPERGLAMWNQSSSAQG